MLYHSSMVISVAEQRMAEARQRAERTGRIRRARGAAASRPAGRRHAAYRRVLAAVQPQA